MSVERANLTYRIDRLDYVVPGRVMTGREIRNLPMPAVRDSYDLYLINEGAEDVLVTEGMLIPFVIGRRFFTVPKIINAGSECANQTIRWTFRPRNIRHFRNFVSTLWPRTRWTIVERNGLPELVIWRQWLGDSYDIASIAGDWGSWDKQRREAEKHKETT